MFGDQKAADVVVYGTERGRRRFLTGTVAGWLGIFALPVGRAAAREDGQGRISEGERDLVVTAADSLFLYLNLLTDVQFSSLRKDQEAWLEAARLASNKFQELSDEVVKLETLYAPQRNSRLQQLRSWTEMGAASARLIKAVEQLPPMAMQSHNQALSIATERLDKNATEFLADGRVILSVGARKQLDKILKLIGELRLLEERSDMEREKYQYLLPVRQNQLSGLNASMLSAMNYVADAQSKQIEAKVIRENAEQIRSKRGGGAEQIASELLRKIPALLNEARSSYLAAAPEVAKALGILKEIPSSTKYPTAASVWSSKALLEAGLEGVLAWINAESEVKQARGGARIDKASFSYLSEVSFIEPQTEEEKRPYVRAILKNCCGPDNVMRAVTVASLIWPSFFRYRKPEDRESFIGTVLFFFNCYNPNNRSQLIHRLARLF